MNKNFNTINKDSNKNKDNNTNNYYKQIFANSMRVYNQEEQNAINKYLNNLIKKRNN